MKLPVAGSIVALTLSSTLAVSQSPVRTETPKAVPVAVIANVPLPAGAPKGLLVGKMRDTIPAYETIPGLNFKMYTLGPSGFGGIYLWTTRDRARAWFSPAWFERVEKERGVKGEVRYFDAPVIVDNARTGETPDAVATLVTIPIPAGATRDRIVEQFHAAVPTYQKIPGLLRKYFILTDDGKFGGIYLWASRAEADQWFSAAWHDRVRKTYGAEAAMEWFEVPIQLPSKVVENRIDSEGR